MALIQTSSFESVADTLTQRVSELLNAPVSLVDRRGATVASARPIHLGMREASSDGDELLRVAVKLHGEAGEVVVGTPQGDEAISPRLAQALVELVATQTMILERLPNQHELKNTFISNLLHGILNDEETILQQAKPLGLDFTPPRAVILIDAADYILNGADSVQEAADARVRRRAQLVIGSIVGFFHLPSDTICAYIGDGEVAVLKASNNRNLGRWAERGDGGEQFSASWANLHALKRAGEALLDRLCSDTGASINVGIGRYHPGVRGLTRSYHDARAALSLGSHFHGQNGVHCLDSLGIAAFVGVSDERTKIDLATNLLSPLDHERDLLETLDVFFAEDCCPSSTATRLSIHRNTLAYRLDKIASLTGLDPRRFDAAVQMRLALLLRSLGRKGQ